MPQDKQLTPREQEFIAELYDKYFNTIFLYVNSALLDKDMAQDVTQDVFHEAAKHINEESLRKNPRGWLRKTAGYKVANNNRMHKRLVRRIVFMDGEQLDQAAAVEDPVIQKLEEESGDPLERVKDVLTEDEFKLLKCIAFEKKSHAKAAKELGITIWTSQKRLVRIREKLRAVFPRYRKKK